ncbi:hypothetical protein FRC02_006047 [Tulasnella sp. 418]|nr:hypothetical protein FRC02_006047 [Tulasnella sp. 418]
MQEPASVLFSVMNMVAHLRGGKYLMRKISKSHPMRGYYRVWTFVNVNAWLWSSVFHTRGEPSWIRHRLWRSTEEIGKDVPRTEKLDYFSAALAIVYSVFMAVVRLFHLYKISSHQTSLTKSPPAPTPGRRRQVVLLMWGYICLFTLLAHVFYLTVLPRFDYTYNMAFNITLAALYSLLWLCYSLPISLIRRYPYSPPSYRPAFAWKPGAIVLLTACAMSLELLDFPPWNRILDAHALWHLSTVPIVLMWYNFFADDSLDEGWRGGRL